MRPARNRIKPTCRDYPGIEPVQLRKWIRNAEALRLAEPTAKCLPGPGHRSGTRAKELPTSGSATCSEPSSLPLCARKPIYLRPQQLQPDTAWPAHLHHDNMFAPQATHTPAPTAPIIPRENVPYGVVYIPTVNSAFSPMQCKMYPQSYQPFYTEAAVSQTQFGAQPNSLCSDFRLPMASQPRFPCYRGCDPSSPADTLRCSFSVPSTPPLLPASTSPRTILAAPELAPADEQHCAAQELLRLRAGSVSDLQR